MDSEVQFDPVSDFILVRKITKNQTVGGIALPDGVDDGPPKGVVVRAGPGRVTELGSLIEMPVKEGDTVYCCFNMTGPPPEIQFGKETYMVIRARDLIGKVPDGKACSVAMAEAA